MFYKGLCKCTRGWVWQRPVRPPDLKLPNSSIESWGAASRDQRRLSQQLERSLVDAVIRAEEKANRANREGTSQLFDDLASIIKESAGTAIYNQTFTTSLTNSSALNINIKKIPS